MYKSPVCRTGFLRLNLIGIRRASSLAVFNSDSRAKRFTLCGFPVFRLRESLENLLAGTPIPRQGPLALPCEHSTGGAHAPCRALNTGSLLAGNYIASCVWKRPQDVQLARQGR